MSETPVAAEAIEISQSTTAPFIFFDSVSACGTLSGAIQLELVARALLMTSPITTKTEIKAVAHLRCSPAAAIDLREMIGRALDMLANPQIPEGQAN